MAKKPQSIEKEFGVPIPGEILEPERWAKTALKKLPLDGPLDVTTLFGRTAPLIVDLGCGNGRFVLASALARPECDHIGIDILPMVLRYATRRANQRGLSNVRFAAVDGQRFVSQYLTPDSVREVHCYHPQPFHDREEAGKRLLAARFLAQVHGVLEPGGKFFVQTDNLPYWTYFRSIVTSFFDFHEVTTPWPDAPRGRTRREILTLSRGYPIYRGWGMVKKSMSAVEAVALAATMPLPTFDAGPRRKDLDQFERE